MPSGSSLCVDGTQAAVSSLSLFEPLYKGRQQPGSSSSDAVNAEVGHVPETPAETTGKVRSGLVMESQDGA